MCLNGDPDRSAASYLGLHCLPISLLWNTRHKWVNVIFIYCREVLFDCLYKKEVEDTIRMLYFIQGDSIKIAKMETTKISFSRVFSFCFFGFMA